MQQYVTTLASTSGQVIWCGYVMKCHECGAASGWDLTIEDKPFESGLSAYATCGGGHKQEHPLVYPAMVRAVAATIDNPDGNAVSEALTAIGWRPHQCHWADLEDADHTLNVDYEPWDRSLAEEEQHGTGYGTWHFHYPDLVAAYKSALAEQR